MKRQQHCDFRYTVPGQDCARIVVGMDRRLQGPELAYGEGEADELSVER